jgi:hypothetical protein
VLEEYTGRHNNGSADQKGVPVGRFPQPQGAKGSLRWIQHLVNQSPAVLDGGLGIGPVEWRSPRADDGYAEYRDQAFLDRLGVTLPKRQLDEFWPPGGPQWDALGRGPSGEVVLVEAKAHVSELLSQPTQASEASAQMIGASLLEAAEALKASQGTDWSKRFYQYANRLAHAWFLAQVNGLTVRLAFVHFIGDADMDGPSSRREWEAALTVLHEALGLRGRLPCYVAEIFIDVRPAVPALV